MLNRMFGRRRGEGAFGAVVGIALAIVVSIILLKVVPIHYKGNTIHDAMKEQANFGGVKAFDKIAYEVFRVAQEQQVPLPLTEIKVSRSGGNIIINAKYEVTTNILGYKYVYRFDRTVEKPVF